MENWRLDKDGPGADTDFELGALRTSISENERSRQHSRELGFEEDERRLSEKRRTSIGWSLPDREPSEEYLRRHSISLGIEDTEERELLKEINERDRVLLEKSCCSEDVIRVWNQISLFIISRLKEGTGVQIPGLYTITFQVEKTIMPKDKEYYIMKKIPVMIMSRFVVETYGLRNKVEDDYVFRAPSVALNLSSIGTKLKLSRNIVDGAVTEVLQAFARALISNKRLEFPLPMIGKLQVCNRQAVMKFYDEFYKNMGYDMEPTSLIAPFRRRRLSSNVSGNGEPLISNVLPEIDFETIPGQMTPLRRHIPTESFRSVFHLREVRSVHEDELLAPVKPNPQARQYKLSARSDPSACHYKLSTRSDQSAREHRLSTRSDRNDPEVEQIPSMAEEEDEEEDAEETPAARQVEEPEEHKTSKKSVRVSLPEVKKPEEKRFMPTQLYSVRPTGKFTIDLIMASQNMYQEVLNSHHHKVCSGILGIPEVLNHYKRRARVPTKVKSYDDPYEGPPSP